MVLPLELITMVIIILRVEGKRYIVSQYLCNRLFHTSLISMLLPMIIIYYEQTKNTY